MALDTTSNNVLKGGSRVRTAAEWFGVFGGACAWLAHLLFAYAVAEFACVAGIWDTIILGMMARAWVILVFSIGAGAVAIAATVVSLRMFKRNSERNSGEKDHPGQESPTTLLILCGVILNIYFVAAIIYQSVPIYFYRHGCS